MFFQVIEFTVRTFCFLFFQIAFFDVIAHIYYILNLIKLFSRDYDFIILWKKNCVT